MSDRWRRYLRFWGPDVDADVDDEVRHHLDLAIESFIARGHSPESARRAALDAFGDVDAVRRNLRSHDLGKLRQLRRNDMLQDLTSDLRYAIRQLSAAPRFSVSVVLVLALGIGANTAIFSVIDAAFFRPLPFPYAERLVSIAGIELPFEASQGYPQSSPQLRDVTADTAMFQRVAAYASGGLNLTGGAEPSRVNIAYVTPGFFTVLGRGAAIGRVPVAEEFAKHGPLSIVVSNALWQREFGGDASVIGRTVGLNGTNYRVVGVMPAEFRFPAGTEVWIPLQLPFGFDVIEAFRNYMPSVTIARLAPGVTVAEAIQHIDALRRRYRTITADDTPTADLVRPLQGMLVGDRRTALFVLAASAGLLLVIACANVTNLLLARAAARQREIAVRAVLGATRTRIVRQLTVESLLLALGGAVMAVGISQATIRALATMVPAALAGVSPPSVDGRVLLFTLFVALVTSLVFGVWPALAATRTDLNEAMKTAGAGGGATRRRNAGRGVLVVTEVALAVILLVGSGLMLESLWSLLRADAGIHADRVVTGRLVLPQARFPNAQSRSSFLEAVIARLHAVPDVAAAAAVSALPMEGVSGVSLAVGPDDAYDPAHRALGAYLMATPGYFATMGARFRGGDLPAIADTNNKVVVINEALAKELWPGKDAVGRVMRFGPERRTVIGVVADIRTARLDAAALGQMYLPMSEQPQSYASIVARGSAPAATMLVRLRDAVRAVDPKEPLYSVESMGEVVAHSVAPRRINTILLVVFGGLAVILAAIGEYAVLSYGVVQRTREIGVRIALGARRTDVVRLIVRQGAVLSTIGLAIGICGALALAGLVRTILYEVSPYDARVFVGAAVVLGLVALCATLIPALRATRVDPIAALRAE